MKITPNLIKSQLASSISATRSSRPNVGAATSGNTEKAASVDLSAAARHLAALQNSDHDIDMAKVQALRDAIASGQYKVDTSRIAESLIASARELLK